MLLAVDGTVLGLAVPALTADLRPTAGELLWIVDVYGFVLAGLLIPMGGLGDRFGRRRLLLIGAAAFGADSALAAFATEPEMLIAARALLGIGGGDADALDAVPDPNLFHDARQRTRPSGCGARASGRRRARAAASAGCSSSTSGGARCS